MNIYRLIYIPLSQNDYDWVSSRIQKEFGSRSVGEAFDKMRTIAVIGGMFAIALFTYFTLQKSEM